MAKRIASTVVLWLFLITVLWFFRTPGALVLIGLLSVLTLREFYKLMANAGHEPFERLGLLFGGLITMAPWIEARFGIASHPLLALAVLVLAIRILAERLPEKRVEALSSTLFGLVYVALLFQYLVRIVTPLATDSVQPAGRLVFCLWVVAVAKFCDVGALLTGLAIGRHKMAPLTSPKKTWEGAAGGVLIAMAVAALVAFWGRRVLPAAMTPLLACIMALPVAVMGIISDLIESALKRKASIKDSGNGVPGIGGIFDLTDSLILAAPVGYLLFQYLLEERPL